MQNDVALTRLLDEFYSKSNLVENETCEDDCGYESQPGRKDRKEIHYQYHDMACVKGAKWTPLGNYVGADIAMTMRYEWFALWLDYSKNRARARVN